MLLIGVAVGVAMAVELSKAVEEAKSGMVDLGSNVKLPSKPYLNATTETSARMLNATLVYR